MQTHTFVVSAIFRRNSIFFKWYGWRWRRALKAFETLFVQNAESKELLAELGFHNVVVAGDTRFDRVIDIQNEAKHLPLCETFAQGRQVLVAGSSWAPDEDILIDYFNRHDGWRLILAPHVVSDEHLREMEGKLRRPAVRYTQASADNVAQAECLIIDCYGLLSSIYRYAKVAYVGGGFGVGIHNTLEAAVYGMPVVFGPKWQKFREARGLLEVGAAVSVKNYREMAKALDSAFANQQQMGKAATDYVNGELGATEKIYSEVF